MKIPLLVFVTMFTFAVVLTYSCNKNDFRSVKEESSISKSLLKTNNIRLSEDENFINLTREMFSSCMFISDVVNRQELNFESTIDSLEILNKDLNNSFENQIEKINIIFNEDISERLIDHMEVFSFNWKLVNEKFGELTSEDMEESMQIVIENEILNNSSPCHSPWRYGLCMAGAISAAVLCHGSCTAATAGFGLPACVALCLTIEAAAADLCHRNFCE